jgi:hypothetical protein
MNKIPVEIETAISAMLAPYGGLAALTRKTEVPAKKYFTVAQACELISCSRWLLIRANKAGKLPVIKMADARAGKILIEASALEKFINSKRVRGGK